MDREKKQPRREEDPQQFERIHEARKEQAGHVSEESSEEDRRQWERTRDMHEEASKMANMGEIHERSEQLREERVSE